MLNREKTLIKIQLEKTFTENIYRKIQKRPRRIYPIKCWRKMYQDASRTRRDLRNQISEIGLSESEVVVNFKLIEGCIFLIILEMIGLQLPMLID